LTTLRTVAEIVIGVLYAIGAGRQALYVVRHSHKFYSDMADRAWISPAKSFIDKVLLPNSVLITILVAVFQAAVAIAILTGGPWAGPALVAGGVFSIVGALTGSPTETVGFGILAAIHFWLASAL
jgi:hypothetical protein